MIWITTIIIITIIIILIDSIYIKGENYYPKVFLEKYYFMEDIESIIVKNI